MALIDFDRRAVGDELDQIAALVYPLEQPGALDLLLERIGDCRYVLLGEASHGTSEYYRWRAEITRRLITEKDFSFVAVEGDWPDCFAINRWVKARADQHLDSVQVLSRFARWPTWMWANTEVAAFAAWLREFNLSTGATVGFYGLDVYSLWESLDRVLGYLGDNHPDALAAARRAAACFEPYGGDPWEYGWAARLAPASCEDEVVDLLCMLHVNRPVLGDDDPEAELDAVQNAEVVSGAERYYRSMVQADTESWNIRDCHMADTLDRLMTHHGRRAKAVVWEHNTHIGDARATDMAAAGMLNVGQVVRQRHGQDGVMVVGFAGHHGSVIASDSWGAPFQQMTVPAPPGGTHEDLLHQVSPGASLLVFGEDRQGPWLSARRGHRAIGVVYHPQRERYGNWVPTVMGRRYDAFCYFDETKALQPLHAETARPTDELETYPFKD